jgi:hypothetical protein
MLVINNLKLSIDVRDDELAKYVGRELNVNTSEIKDLKIVKRSLDARKGALKYQYNIAFSIKDEAQYISNNVLVYTPFVREHIKVNNDKRVCVIGYGPAGMFAALNLAQSGINVDVYERGASVEERVADIEAFKRDRVLNVESNIQFGEGGAGTFSDGKLTARSKNPLAHYVFDELIEAGANPEIAYVHNPHVGTDVLRDVVKNIRNKTIQLGAKINFKKKVSSFRTDGEKITSIFVEGEELIYDDYILAIGHSARDTFYKLKKIDTDMKAKPFAVGFRIEHEQKMIDKRQYRSFYDHPRLGAAEYKLKHQSSDGHGVYSFCMCPGGEVVAAQSETNTVVVNGMSEFARNKTNANSAILCTVTPDEIKGDSNLRMLDYQRQLERNAFALAGGDYSAPAQLVRDYLNGVKSKEIGSIKPSYPLGVKLCKISRLFTEEQNKALREGLKRFEKLIPGFATSDAIITGVESRSSSPVWITREKETYHSVSFVNLYPCGEGAGFAGGITSSAIDGIKVSDALIKKYSN